MAKYTEEEIKDMAEKLAVALNFCPPIYRCADCNRYVVDGYCCNKCGSVDPRTKSEAVK